MNPIRRSPQPAPRYIAEAGYMSGVQGGGCHLDNAMILLMNFERPTTCQYYMPYVVG
jgi:hypothetical protein